VPKSVPITIENEFSTVTFLKNRTPDTTNEEASDEEANKAFALLSEYRDGGIYIAHYSGFSEWEMHPKGDEFVHVLAGNTRLILLENSQELAHELSAGQILVVPQGVWHRFESPDGVKMMTITPQPTEHSRAHPELR
jgi:mannose-6-phosphate isomerase-like protein (cupin superfamily)